MLIDWFTVIAQAINFLILVWLLKRYLYTPVLNALDAREKRISAALADADAKKTEANREREEFKHKNEAFEQQRSALLSQVTQAAAAERQKLFDAARTDAESLRTKQMETLNNEFQSLNTEIAQRTRSEVFAITRKALADLAGVGLEERMVEVFVRRLRDLDAEEKAKLLSIVRSSNVAILVRSSFDLAQSQRALIEETCKATLAGNLEFRFEISPDLISGIELVMQGYKLAWNIVDYLGTLDKSVNELLKGRHQTTAHDIQNPK